MVFSSLIFLCIFLPVFLVLYYLCPYLTGERHILSGNNAVTKAHADRTIFLRNMTLLIFSLIFYAWGEPLCIFLMLISAFVDYTDGLLLTRFDDNKVLRRIFLITALIINLSLLGVFKYADMAVSAWNLLPFADVRLPGIALPVGISFYTFQTVSYSIDVYRRKVKAERNYFRYLTYVSMFPQLIAGPIVRYETVAVSLHDRRIASEDFSEGMRRFLMGLFRKVLIANPLGEMFAGLKAVNDLSVSGAWLGLLTFTLELYFDFSAYSDMAIGLGRMLGFRFPENFRYPLAADSMTEFWRRWHISLSSWFRDYVYIPMGGNRRGNAAQIRNLVIVWALTGLWHGAAVNFVLWGLWHCAFLILEKFVYGERLGRLPAFFRHLYTLLIIVIGFGIFTFDDPGELAAYFSSVFGLSGGALAGSEVMWYIRSYATEFTMAVVLSFPVYPWLMGKIRESRISDKVSGIVSGILYIVLFIVTIASLVRDSYNPFLYFRF